MKGVLEWVFGAKVMGVLGLACLLFGGVLLAFYLSGKRLPPPPERSELAEVAGNVVVVTYGETAVFYARKYQQVVKGWQLVVDPGQRQEPVTLAIGEWPPFGAARDLDLGRVEALLPRGARVRAWVQGSPLVWHLESEGKVLVDYAERRAAHEAVASRDLWLMVLLLVLGPLLCARAVWAWWAEPSRAEGAAVESAQAPERRP
jgi:hypothetical protein